MTILGNGLLGLERSTIHLLASMCRPVPSRRLLSPFSKQDLKLLCRLALHVAHVFNFF